MFALRQERPSRPTNLGEPLTAGTALFLYLGGGALLLSLFGGKKKKKDEKKEEAKQDQSAANTGFVVTLNPLDPARVILPGNLEARKVNGRWFIDPANAEKFPEYTPEWWRSHNAAETADRVRQISYEYCRTLRNPSTKQPNTKADCADLISRESMEYCVFRDNKNASAEELNKACAGKLPNDVYIAQDTSTYGW